MARGMRQPLSFAERCYQKLLWLYPASFRNSYSLEMQQTFRAWYREVVATGSRWQIARFWGSVLGDLCVSVCVEYRKTMIHAFKVLLGLEKELLMTNSLLNLNVAYRTDIGLKRASNEDNVLSYVPQDPQEMERKGALFVVADGMGGHANGEVASELAVNGIRAAYYQDGSNDSAESLQHAVEQANLAIYNENEARNLRLPGEQGKESAGMGATVVATVLKDDRVYVANAGDSLAYIVRGDQVLQITEDHSYIADQARKLNLTLEDAKVQYAEKRNVVMRCLGTKLTEEIYVASEVVRDGDILVLCTDGLTNLIDEVEIRSIVQHYEPDESAQRLIARANELGGPDNSTALVVRIALSAKNIHML